MPPVLCAVAWTPRFLGKSGNRVSGIHNFCCTDPQDLPSPELRYAMTLVPLSHLPRAHNSDCRAIAFRDIAIPGVTIPLPSETPKCRTPIPLDPRTRVLRINGSDRVGKSLIAISTCKVPVSGIPILRFAILGISCHVPLLKSTVEIFSGNRWSRC
jgi:hypothetical protein